MTHHKVLRFLAYAALALPALPPVLFPVFEPYTFGKTVLFEIIVEAMALIWLAARWQGIAHTAASLAPRVKTTLGIMVLLFGASMLISANISASFWGSSARMDGYFTLVHFFAFFAVLAMTFAYNERRAYMRFSVGAGTFAALYGIAQWFGTPFVVPAHGEIFGTLGNPSYLVLYCLFTMFIAHYCAEREQKRERAILLYCAAAIQAIALLLTQVQAALLALGVGAIIAAYPYIRAHSSVRRAATAGIVVCVLILLLFSNTHFAKLASFSEGTVSLENRIMVWRIALWGIAEKPLFGHGANIFAPWYLAKKSGGAAVPATGEAFDKPHNAFLEIMFSYGIIGFVAYLFFVWEIVRRARTFPALIAALIAYLVFLFFFFDTFASWLMFFFIAAFLAAPPAPTHEKIIVEPRIASIRFGIGSAVFVAMFFAFHFIPLYSAYFANRFLVRAATARTADETLKARALRYHAFNTPFIERAIMLTERAIKK